MKRIQYQRTGPASKHDWVALRREYEDSGEPHLLAWCTKKEISYSYASKKFSEIDRIEDMENLAVARRRLARMSPQAAQRLGELTDSEDEGTKLKASTAILDRVGLNPQAATINIQNVNATQIQIPPMFAEENRDDLKQLLGGDEE